MSEDNESIMRMQLKIKLIETGFSGLMISWV